MPEIRCSALPRVLACHASARKPEIVIDSKSEPARMGSAVHEFCARMVRNETEPFGEIFVLASKWGVEEDDISPLCFAALREWNRIKEHVNVLSVESKMEGLYPRDIVLSGHVDLLAELVDDPETKVIIDWKSGYKESNPLDQLNGYALLAMNSGPVDTTRYRLMTVWLRLGVIETHEIDLAGLLAFLNEIADALNDPDTYSPSDENCRYCPLAPECAARRSLLESAGNDMLALAKLEPGEITPAKLAALYPQSRMLKKALDSYEKSVRQAVEDAGGALESDAGQLRLVAHETSKVKFAPDTLSQYLEAWQIDAMRPYVSRDALRSALGENAPARGKGKHIAAALAAFEVAGIVDKQVITKLEFRPAKKEE